MSDQISREETRAARGRRGMPDWHPEEDAILRRLYRTKGAQFVSDKLAEAGFYRSRFACVNRASRLGVEYDPASDGHRDRGLVYLSDAMPVSPRKVQATRRIVKAAREAGVLKRALAYPHKYMAPARWVDEYMEAIREETKRADYLRANWIRTEDVGELFGFSLSTIRAYLGESRAKRHITPSVRPYLDAIPSEVVNGYGRNMPTARYWDPHVARVMAARWKAVKRADPRRRGGGKRKARQ